jgi:hypothetical protein
MAFLSGLLKTAMAVSTSSICTSRADIEKQIGMQLDHVILEDILIASGVGTATSVGQQHALYDTDMVVCIFSMFLNHNDDEEEEDVGFDYDSPRSPKQSLLVKGAKLLNSLPRRGRV